MSCNDLKIQDEESSIENGFEDYLRLPEMTSTPNTTKEWSYIMRRSMQEVAPGLYLGPYSSASRSQLQSLKEIGITHIICVRQDIESQFIKPNFPDDFEYLVLNIADTVTENIIQHFRRVKEFINKGLNSGGRVLVHGNAGISRSAALVLAYIMERYNCSPFQAYTLVQHRRFCINPNDGFMAQLREYEPIYKAQRMHTDNRDSIVENRCKRTIHQIDTERAEAMES
ncbi:serine/threonine/tyrosine-interacting protein-like [Microplitis mediator]|uniref:serine/threonine/tyrosine-interacting protein-like n=1 Tax=Microplitis mediator TaxID=375433 RepID=UPI0025540AE3|nr:serine/threonine/tyrosine-interacting protein-like [Microplitis mediator]XP_057330070.1 serine/threonine/tyrosine-interacting protein-like [Microplitis mediator]